MIRRRLRSRCFVHFLHDCCFPTQFCVPLLPFYECRRPQTTNLLKRRRITRHRKSSPERKKPYRTWIPSTQLVQTRVSGGGGNSSSVTPAAAVVVFRNRANTESEPQEVIFVNSISDSPKTSISNPVISNNNSCSSHTTVTEVEV